MLLIRTIFLALTLLALFAWPAAPFAGTQPMSAGQTSHGACPDCDAPAPCPDGMALGCAACPLACPLPAEMQQPAAAQLSRQDTPDRPAISPLSSPDRDPPPPSA